MKRNETYRIVVMEVLPNEEVPEYLCLWDGGDEEDANSLTGYFLHRVSKHGLIYKEEN